MLLIIILSIYPVKTPPLQVLLKRVCTTNKNGENDNLNDLRDGKEDAWREAFTDEKVEI